MFVWYFTATGSDMNHLSSYLDIWKLKEIAVLRIVLIITHYYIHK